MKVLYIFAGRRKQDEERFRRGELPDTYLSGLNHLSRYGIKADYIENRSSEYLRRLSFNLAALPSLLAAHRYDIVFSGGSPVFIWLHKKLMRNHSTRWVVYNTFLTNLLKRHQHGAVGRMARESICLADGIINPSTPQRDFLTSEGFHSEKLFYLPYGVDKEFIDNHLGRPRLVTRPYIFSAGKDMGRDYQTLIEAVRGLPIEFYIGASPRNFKDIGGIPPNVHISFFRPGELVAMYEHAEFVVIPTYGEDNLSGSDCSGQYVLLEAMMCGKAVIASDRSTIYDYVAPDTHAVLVEPENPAALRAAIESLLSDKEKSRSLGRAARERAAADFTSERFGQNLAAVFRQIYEQN